MLDLERLLLLDELLRTRRRPTAQSLADELECNEKTVRRYLEYMRDRFDAPIEHNRQRGWHYTSSDWRLSSVSLTKGELFALTLGARMLSAYGGSAYSQELKSAIDQLVKRLPDEMAVDLELIAQERVLFAPGASVDVDQSILQKLFFACQTNRQIKMRYFTAQRNDESERVVDPYVVYFSATNPCMSGFCHSREAIRDFRIDRIRQLEVLPTAFQRPSGFDSQAYVEKPFFHERGDEAQSIRIWFDAVTAPYIRERQWHQSQILEEQADGAVIFGFTAHGLAEVKRWVMYYGRGARVLEPPELVAMVWEEVQGMYASYLNS